MYPKIQISKFLLERLKRVKQQSSGCLFGIVYGDGTLLLMGFNVESTIGQLNYKKIQQKFPAEMDLCGIVKFGDCSDAEAHIAEILKDVDITDNPILLHCELGTLVGLKVSIFMHEKLQEIPYEIIEANKLYENFCFARLKCNFSIITDEKVDSVRIKQDMQILRKNVACGSLAFNIRDTKIFVTGTGTNGAKHNLTNGSTINDILKLLMPEMEKIKSKKTNKNAQTDSTAVDYDIININVLRNKTKELQSNGYPSALSMSVERETNKLYIPLDIDTMAVLYKHTNVSGLYDILIENICRSLRLFELALIDCLNNNLQISTPRSYHFSPPDFGHFISCVYLDDVSEDDVLAHQRRKKLHYHFGLPTTRPYFRKANRYIFKDELPPVPLINTHIGAKPSLLREGRQYLVQGTYSYYHYMQQNFNDNGWGCAYRSLQTLCSWFRWQGYTERDVPTHIEIQKYLVKIGDKPTKFIDSKQWIGSTEVAMCLQGFLNVDSRILHVSSGADLSSKGSELAMHFETNGTPIMIGGGVLAHTIIGIDFNGQSGEIKYLILDPHYTDTDDLQVIQSKGWCGWKGPDFWDKKSYYNLCMPQRPIMY